MARFDWYQCTIHGVAVQTIADQLAADLLADLAPGPNLNGYTHGAVLRRGDRVLVSLCYGGQPGVNVKVTGDDSPTVADLVRRHWPEHNVTRVDACKDWVEPGLFDFVSDRLIAYAKHKDLSIDQQGDWARGLARTLYLGARSSVVRLVLYEKGYETGGDPAWVRLEVRVRPKGLSRLAVATWAPSQCFEASAWLVEALECIGWRGLQARSVGTVWRPSDTERARAAMLRQYGRIISEWAEEVGGWGLLGDSMLCKLREIEGVKMAMR